MHLMLLSMDIRMLAHKSKEARALRWIFATSL